MMARLGLSLAVLSFLAPAFAAAQDVEPSEPTARDEEARVLFSAGRIAFDEAHYDDAYARFSEAYRLSERPELLYNMASAADRSGRTAEALEHYRAFLAAIPDTPRRLEVEHRIAVLEAEVAAAPVAAPEETVADPAAVPSGPETAAPTPLYAEWWLWTIVGVAVVGIGVGIGAGVAASGTTTAAPLPGDVGPGGVVFTLTSAF